MSVPLSKKARGLTVSTYVAPSAKIHAAATFPAPVEVRVPVPTAVIRKGNAQIDSALHTIKRRYEDEARQVQQNYEVDFNNHVSLLKTVEELQILLDEERGRSLDLENRYNAAVIELEKEKRLRTDFEHECKVLSQELRRADGIVADAELKMSRLQQDVTHLDAENKDLRAEIHRLTDIFNVRVRDCEERYMMEITDLTADVERLRTGLEQQRSDYENRLRDLDRDWGTKFGRLEEECMDKERLVAELEAELRRLTDHITEMKIDYEEELRRQVILVREEELHKFQGIIKGLEVKLHQCENERNLLAKKNQDLTREVHVRDRQIQDLKMHYENEAARFRADIDELRNQVNALNAANDRLRSELGARETAINRLEAEIVNLERELNRLKEIHVQEINRLVNDHLNERRRWEEAERVLKARIAELERIVRALEGENGKLRGDIERLKEHVTGNIHRTIFQTFVDYDATTGIKPLY